MIDTKKMRDFVIKLRNRIFTAQIETSMTERQHLSDIMTALREAADSQTLVVALKTPELSVATQLDISTAYWEYMDGVVIKPLQPRNAEDLGRVSRIVHEINLLHLDLLHETFEAGMKIRVEEMKELTNFTAENLPTQRDLNYSTILAHLGYRNRIVHSQKVFKGLARQKQTISMSCTQEQREKALEELKEVSIMFTRKNSGVETKDLLHALTVNWINIGHSTDYVMGFKPSPVNETARLAYLMHCDAVNVPTLQQPPWEAASETYQSAMEMLVLECYRWVQTNTMGPPSYSTIRAIRQLSGLSGPWDLDLRTDPGMRAIVTAAVTLPPIDPAVIALH